MPDMDEIKSLIVEQGEAWVKWKSNFERQLAEEKAEREELELRLSRSGAAVKSGEPMPAERKALNDALRAFIRDDNRAGLDEIARKAMSVGSDPDGGYTVYPTISGGITRKVHEISPFRQLARVETIGSDAFEELLDLEEAEAVWVGETSARTSTDTPQIGKLRIPVHEIYAAPKVTQKLLDDSSRDIAAWIVEKVASRFARKEGAAFITGTGVGTPRGILTYPTAKTPDATRPWGTFEHIASGNASAFTGTNPSDRLIDVVHALKAEYRAGASWMMNRKTAAVVRKFKTTDGHYLWADGIGAGQPDRLLGFPVTLDEEFPDIGAGALPIAFGDFRNAYTIVDRHGDRLLRDPFTQKPHVIFYTYRRVGGDVNNFEAAKFIKIEAD